MDKIKLKYGNEIVEIKLPKGKLLSILEGKALPTVCNSEEAVREALENPIELPPFPDLFDRGDTVAIIVSDKSRKTHAEVFLPIIIEELKKSGVSTQDITILFGCGVHPGHTKDEQKRIVGEEVAVQVRLFDHIAQDTSALQYVGTTSRGTKVYFNKALLKADKIIVTGSITYHYFAGFSGGRKGLLPGVAGEATIQANHRLCMTEKGNHPLATTGQLSGNPVHEDMTEAASFVNPTFLLNTISNSQGALAAVLAGHWERAFLKGCSLIDAYFRVPFKEPADLVIASAGGYPKDLNFVQSHKAMDSAARVLKPGGVMILLAQSKVGFTKDEYRHWLTLGSPKRIEKELTKNCFSIPGHTVYATFQKAEKFKIIWVTEQNHREVKKMGIIPARSYEEALEITLEYLPKDFTYYVMPNAYSTLPQLIEEY
jgi:nickel-dependent lactate racemase